MPVPTTLRWPRDPHTEAKHRVIRGYLDAWWPILLSAWPMATYAEGYAGPGEYEQGEDGSPLIAIRSLRERTPPLPPPDRTVRIALVEERADRLQHCLQRIDREFGGLPATVSVTAAAGRCEEQLLPLLDRIKAWGFPMLVVLDPYGAGVPYDVVCRVAQNPSSEVLVSFMSQWFIRWANNENLDHGDRQFGETDWRQVIGLPSHEKQLWLVNRYRRRLADAGFNHTAWFELVDEGGIGYSLIFGTKSPKGLEKMKESLWRVDPVAGIHFRDPRDPGQLTFDVADKPQTAALANLLSQHMDGRGLLHIEDLRSWTLEQTAFLPRHVAPVLREWRQAGRLRVEPSGGITRSKQVALVDKAFIRRDSGGEQRSLF